MAFWICITVMAVAPFIEGIIKALKK